MTKIHVAKQSVFTNQMFLSFLNENPLNNHSLTESGAFPRCPFHPQPQCCHRLARHLDYKLKVTFTPRGHLKVLPRKLFETYCCNPIHHGSTQRPDSFCLIQFGYKTKTNSLLTPLTHIDEHVSHATTRHFLTFSSSTVQHVKKSKCCHQTGMKAKRFKKKCSRMESDRKEVWPPTILIRLWYASKQGLVWLFFSCHNVDLTLRQYSRQKNSFQQGKLGLEIREK